jgi:hypothetical protein
MTYTDYTCGHDEMDVELDAITTDINDCRAVAKKYQVCLLEVRWNRKDFDDMHVKIIETYGEQT